MAVIKSGATTDELTVDATSKAARVTNYTSDGIEVAPSSTGYILPINPGKIASTLVGSSAIWYMRNPGPKKLRIRRIDITVSVGSDGATATGIAGVAFARVTATTASAAAGSALTVVGRKTSNPASQVTNARQAVSTLTVTNLSFEAPFFAVDIPKTSGAIVTQDIEFYSGGNETELFEVASTEGLVLYIGGTTTAVTSMVVSGSVGWDEV